MEYQQIAAVWLFVCAQYGPVVFGCRFGNGVAGGLGGLVFGTLLGPEATGPGGAGTAVVVLVVTGFVCFWFPGCTDHACLCVWGVWFGVVV